MKAHAKMKRPGPVCRVPLATIGDVKAELGRLYRDARSGKLDWSDCTKGTHVLATIARLIESSDFEARISALERAAAETQRRNGHGHNAPFFG
jgi:hypothetical protein